MALAEGFCSTLLLQIPTLVAYDGPGATSARLQ